jgi:hypothetical protein
MGLTGWDVVLMRVESNELGLQSDWIRVDDGGAAFAWQTQHNTSLVGIDEGRGSWFALGVAFKDGFHRLHDSDGISIRGKITPGLLLQFRKAIHPR